MKREDLIREFEVELDLDATPGAPPPAPRREENTGNGVQAIDGRAAARMAAAALVSRMTDRQVWSALDAANAAALMAIEAGKFGIARRAVARAEALTREAQRRAER